MATPQEFAAHFTRTLDLFRDPGAKEDQKAQFRVLIGMLKAHALTISAADGKGLVVNGQSLGRGPYNSLIQRLDFHSVAEIKIPADPPLAETFELLRLLADQPGDEDLATRLRATGARSVILTIQTLTPPPAPASPSPSPSPAPPPPAPALAPPQCAETSF